MAFRQSSNRTDGWVRFCACYPDLIADISFPAILWVEHRFRDLLRDGYARAGGEEVVLAELSDPDWGALERFVAVFFRECESYAPLELFPAFRREVERRVSGFSA